MGVNGNWGSCCVPRSVSSEYRSSGPESRGNPRERYGFNVSVGQGSNNSRQRRVFWSRLSPDIAMPTLRQWVFDHQWMCWVHKNFMRGLKSPPSLNQLCSLVAGWCDCPSRCVCLHPLGVLNFLLSWRVRLTVKMCVLASIKSILLSP